MNCWKYISYISPYFAEYQFNILESLLGRRGGSAHPCTLPLGPRLHRIYWILKLFWPNCITFYFFFSYFKKVGDFPSTKALLGVNWSLHPLYLTKNLTIHRIDPDGCSKFWFPLQRDLIVAKPKSPILTVKSSWRKMSKQSQGFRRVTATTRCRILLLPYLTIPPFMYSSVYFIASLKTKRTLKFNSHLHNCVFCC